MANTTIQGNLEIKQTGTMPANYVEALVKLIPAVVLGLFVVLGGVIPTSNFIAAVVISVIAVVAVPLFMIFVSKVTRISQIVISTISMAFYASVTVPIVSYIPDDKKWIPFVIVITWTVFAPLFYIKTSITEGV